METPIDPPGNPEQVCLGVVKQEDRGEQSKSGQNEVPEQTSLENVTHEKTQKNTAAEDGGDEQGPVEESFTSESNMEQSENEGQTLQQEGSSTEQERLEE